MRIGRRERAAAALATLVAAGALPGCYAPQLTSMRAGLDSLRAVVDTMAARDSTALALIGETRREMAEQRDILLSTRATTGTTTQELFEQMGRLEGKLDEVMGKFQSASQRSATPGAAGAGDPNQLYDQASQDLTQGRYALALRGFRDFLERHPQVELSDNAQYGIGESFFAQSVFDSAALEYAKVEERYPKGDRVPAALYKLGLSRERQGKTADAKKIFEDLVKRFPNSGEAQLARERLGGGTRR